MDQICTPKLVLELILAALGSQRRALGSTCLIQVTKRKVCKIQASKMAPGVRGTAPRHPKSRGRGKTERPKKRPRRAGEPEKLAICARAAQFGAQGWQQTKHIAVSDRKQD